MKLICFHKLKIIFLNVLFLLISISILASCSKNKISQFDIKSDELVYICTGRLSKAYHITKDCRGLKNCSSDLEKVKKIEADEMNRHLCGFCRD